MGLAANLTERGRLCVVDAVPYGRERLEVGKCGGQILVRHAAIGVPWHDLAEPAGPHKSSADRLRKKRVVVIRNPRRVERDVGAGHAAPGTVENKTAGKLHARQGLTVCILRRMAILAAGNADQIGTALFGSGK